MSRYAQNSIAKKIIRFFLFVIGITLIYQIIRQMGNRNNEVDNVKLSLPHVPKIKQPTLHKSVLLPEKALAKSIVISNSRSYFFAAAQSIFSSKQDSSRSLNPLKNYLVINNPNINSPVNDEFIDLLTQETLDKSRQCYNEQTISKLAGRKFAYQYDDRELLLIKGAANNLLYNFPEKCGSVELWSGLSDLGTKIIDSPAVVQHNNCLKLFVVGRDYKIRYASLYQEDNSIKNWNEVEQGDEGYRFVSSPTVIYLNGYLELFAVDQENIIRHKFLKDGDSNWSRWHLLGRRVPHLAPVVIHRDGWLELFTTSTTEQNNNLWYIFRKDGRQLTNWSGWVNLDGHFLFNPAIIHRNGYLELFCVGVDNKLWHKCNKDGDSSKNWLGWYDIGDNIAYTPIVIHRNGYLELFAVTTDDKLLYKRHKDNDSINQWSKWYELGSNIASIISAVHYNGYLELSVVGTDNKLLYKRHKDGSGITEWSAWFNRDKMSIANFYKKTNRTYLHACAAAGDKGTLEKAIKMAKGNIEIPDNQGNTPLCIAASEGNFNAVHLLVTNNANIYHQTANGDTPLILTTAKYAETSYIIKKKALSAILLLKAGANATLKNKNSKAFLNLAKEISGKEFLKYVIPYLDKKRNGISAEEAAMDCNIDLQEAVNKRGWIDKALEALNSNEKENISFNKQSESNGKTASENANNKEISYLSVENIGSCLNSVYEAAAKPQTVITFLSLAMTMGYIYGFKSRYCLVPLMAAFICLIAFGLKRVDVLSHSISHMFQKTGDSVIKITEAIVKSADALQDLTMACQDAVEKLSQTTEQSTVILRDEFKKALVQLSGSGKEVAAAIAKGIQENRFKPEANVNANIGMVYTRMSASLIDSICCIM